MFVSKVTPAIIIAFAIGFGSPDVGTLVYLIQMSMLFAGIAMLSGYSGFRIRSNITDWIKNVCLLHLAIFESIGL